MAASAKSNPTLPEPTRPNRRVQLLMIVVSMTVGAMIYATKVVTIGSQDDVRADVFSPEAFGASEFPGIRSSILERAVDAATLAKELAADKAAAGAKYGVAAGIGPVIPVSFSGVVGEGRAGNYFVAIDGLPPELKVRVQTGPAINGTELRDATGTIQFGQFTNQIEFQNAGSALNNAMKASVLADLDRNALTGKTISVVGVFKLVSPNNWLVTPVKFDVR